MLGILVGAACLYGLVRMMRGGGWAYAHGPGPWGHHRWGGWRHGGWNGTGRAGSRGPLRWLFERMEFVLPARTRAERWPLETAAKR